MLVSVHGALEVLDDVRRHPIASKDLEYSFTRQRDEPKVERLEYCRRREDMKKIEAIIKPFKLGDVREALIEIGVEGVTVSEVKMLGRQADHTAISRGDEYHSEFLPKLKFEIVVADSRVRRTIRAIVGKARTGRINDGRVFVVPIQEAIRIRTGERGEAAV